MPTFPSGSGVYHIILKYKSTVTASATVTIANAGATQTFVGNTAIGLNCGLQCFTYVDRNFTLAAGVFDVYVALNLANTGDAIKILLQSVVLLPVEFYNADILGSAKSDFLNNCDVLRNNMSSNGTLNPICLAGVFSITMGLLGNPFGKFNFSQAALEHSKLNYIFTEPLKICPGTLCFKLARVCFFAKFV